MRIKENINHQIEISRSRFMCYLFRCFSEDEAKIFISTIKKEHPDANHHCYAYITNNNMSKKCYDDHEPSQTAGKPILEVLEKNSLNDICAIVVRYFGGVKLGTGGLIRAYGKAVSDTIKNSDLVEVKQINIYQLEFSYDYINKIEYILKDYEIVEKKYDISVIYQFLDYDESLFKKIKDATNDNCILTFINSIEKEIVIY